MIAYWSRWIGLASGLAPASMRMKRLLSVGIVEAMPARSTPGSVRSLIVLAATAAPVWPALTTASALPCLTRSTARLTDESFFLRTEATASSPMLHDLAGVDDLHARIDAAEALQFLLRPLSGRRPGTAC